MRLTMLLVGALVAGLLVAPAPASAGDHAPDCDRWTCGLERGGAGSGGSESSRGGWAVWTSRIYTALNTTDGIGDCVMAYPNDDGDLTGPEVLDQIGAAQGAHDRYEEAVEEYEAAKDAYDQSVEEYEEALQALERAEEARDDEDADSDADTAPDAGEGQEAAQGEPDEEAARTRKTEAEAAMAAAQDRLQEADERQSEAEEALDGFPFDIVPGERPRACGSGERAEAEAPAPVPEPRIEPGAALAGITSYLEIDLDVAGDGTFEATMELLGRTFVLQATPTFTVDWDDGAEPEPVGRRRGEPYPGEGPEAITHTYTVADEVDIVVEARWAGTLREVLDAGSHGPPTQLDPVTTTGTYSEANNGKLFPIQQAQAVRVR